MVFPLKFLNFFLFMDMNLTSWTGMKSDGSNNLRQTKGNGVSCLYMNFYKTAGSFFFLKWALLLEFILSLCYVFYINSFKIHVNL